MNDTVPSSTMVCLEHALAAAARRFVDEHRRQGDERTRQHALQAVCARLGLPPADCAALAAGIASPDLRADAHVRLKRDAERLARAARGRRTGYDLDRHIAVHRALAQLGAAPTHPARPNPEQRLSGRALNDRFRNQRSRRDRIERRAVI